MLPFDYHIYTWSWPILKVNVKVTHLPTVNISETVTDRVNITIDINYEVASGLSNGIIIRDLGSFWRSRSRSCTSFVLKISETATDIAVIASVVHRDFDRYFKLTKYQKVYKYVLTGKRWKLAKNAQVQLLQRLIFAIEWRKSIFYHVTLT